MAKRFRNFNKSPDVLGSVAKYSSVLNLGIFAVIGLVVYQFYKFFAASPETKAENAAEKEAMKNYTTRPAEESKALVTLEQTLAKQGLKVSTLHISNANTLNAMMDKLWVDRDSIVNFVKSMSKQTFQLTYIAYKQRSLGNYASTHIFDSDTWGWSDLFNDNKLYGSLKYHLQVVLDDGQFKSLSSWISSVP